MEKKPSKKTTRTRQAKEKGQPAILEEVSRSDKLRRKRFADMAPDLVRATFKGLLGRAPEDEALAYYSKMLAEKQELSAILEDVSGSEEFQRKNFADMAPDLVQNITSVLADIVLSDEFKEKVAVVGGRNVPAFSASDLERQKLVFLHYPKTGGTTLHNILIAAYDKDEVCPERFNGICRYPAGALARYRFFSGHFDLPSVKLIPGRKKVITMLREPVARLISLYYFQRAHRPEAIEQDDLELARLANKYSMADFFRDEEVRSHPAINNAMTRVLVETIDGYRWESKGPPALSVSDVAPSLQLAMRELEAFDAFGIMERYDDSVRLICESIGHDVPLKIERRQVLEIIMDKEPGLRRIDKEPVTGEIRQLIEGLVQTDTKLYLHACSVFEDRLKTLRRRDRRSVNSSPRATSLAPLSEGRRV